jgi:hypothetical protein
MRIAGAIAVLAALAAACATPKPEPKAEVAPTAAPAAPIAPSPEIQRRADADRVHALELEVERLQADLRSAEETLLAVESGMRGAKGRAEAVSALAEARIQVDRAAQRAPWRADEAREAREKLAEADRQLSAGHIGSAVFFVSRASRIASALLAEADRVASDPSTQFIRAARVNLREGPSPESVVLTVLPARLPVLVEGTDGAWSLVRTATGRVGFVHSDLLERR